jgi:LPS-assembly protein
LVIPDSSRRFVQAVADLRQTLALRQGNTVNQILQLDVGQGADLLNQHPADTFARLVASWWLLKSTTMVRYDRYARHWAQVTSETSIDDFRGDALYARFDRLLSGGSDRLRAGIDELIGAPSLGCTPQDHAAADVVAKGLVPCSLSYAQQLVAGFRFKLPIGLGAGYEALIQPLNPLIAGEANTALNSFASTLTQQTISLSYGPACDCWRVVGYARFYPTRLVPDFGLSLTIARFGTFGT